MASTAASATGAALSTAGSALGQAKDAAVNAYTGIRDSNAMATAQD